MARKNGFLSKRKVSQCGKDTLKSCPRVINPSKIAIKVIRAKGQIVHMYILKMVIPPDLFNLQMWQKAFLQRKPLGFQSRFGKVQMRSSLWRPFRIWELKIQANHWNVQPMLAKEWILPIQKVPQRTRCRGGVEVRMVLKCSTSPTQWVMSRCRITHLFMEVMQMFIEVM